MALRLFVSLDLDEAARDTIADGIERLRAAGLDVRFEPREKWHLTLAFLGATQEMQYAGVLDALRAAATRCAPFTLMLDTIGAFPNTARPRVVWVGGSISQPRYAACASAVRTALAGLGFEFKDAAVPHVTVCRLKNVSQPLPPITLSAPTTVSIDSLTLYQSLPDARTTRYAVREKFRLSSM